ncbi:MAG: hypothetical protein KGR26_05460 [Cyanobacteria bacterium REEB65]|nr:hypothetical protein [Cyanobacteria bacterium REEB65]
MDVPPVATQAPVPELQRIVATAPQLQAAVASTPSIAVQRPPLSWIPAHDPAIATWLSIGIDGAGQFYNGEPAKGWWMLGSWLLYPAAWGLDSLFQTGYFRTGALVIELGIKGYSAWDAYRSAEAWQQSHRARTGP